MHITDWNKRWEQNKIGFHEEQPNLYLTQYIHQLNLAQNATVFVPLCGKSNDLKWLADKGYNVVGIECSAIAVKDFFKAHDLKPNIETVDKLIAYNNNNITIFQGDFYDLNTTILAKCDLIYDRASMIAFTEEQRPHYIKHLSQWFNSSTQMLLVTLSYDQNTMNGPPFSVNNPEVEEAYVHKKLKILDSQDVIDETPRWRSVGLTALIETTFHIS